MRRVMVILDRDQEYVSRLAQYFNQHGVTGFKAAAFSSPEAYREFLPGVSVEILLVSELLAPALHGMAGDAKVILLSEDGFVRGGESRPFGAPAVFKYQPADRMAREIMRLYADSDPRMISRVRNGQCEILGIYSPVNRCGKTTLAITLGLVRAERGKTLLLSLEEYAGVFRSLNREAGEDLSDVLYSFLKGSYSWSRLKSSVHSFGRLEYIPPVRCMEDISLLPAEDLQQLLRVIAEEGGYTTLILDFGSFGRRAVELLELCSRIFMPVLEEPLSALKLLSFFEYLDQSGKEELKDRIVKCRLPNEPEKSADYAGGILSVYESSALYTYASHLH